MKNGMITFGMMIKRKTMSCCNECGVKDYSTNYLPGQIKTIMDEESVCFSCAFWLDLYRNCSRPIIIDYEHYVDSGFSNGTSDFLGFAGRVFKIEMENGHQITTNNLWRQGEIPEHFRDRFKNNSKFIEEVS